MFPEETSDAGFNKATLSKARYVLRNSPMVEGERYPKRCLLYALANARAAKTIRQGIEQKRLRHEIRESTYQIFKVVGGL